MSFRPIRLEEYDDTIQFFTEKGSFVVRCLPAAGAGLGPWSVAAAGRGRAAMPTWAPCVVAEDTVLTGAPWWCGGAQVPIKATIPCISSRVPEHLDFGFCPCRETASKTFQVVNDGAAPGARVGHHEHRPRLPPSPPNPNPNPNPNFNPPGAHPAPGPAHLTPPRPA